MILTNSHVIYSLYKFEQNRLSTTEFTRLLTNGVLGSGYDFFDRNESSKAVNSKLDKLQQTEC